MTSTTPPGLSDRFVLHRDPHPARVATFAEDVRAGLGTRPLSLSPKYFYDDLGSALFEAITRLPEYYLTRVERDLLATYGREIASALGPEPLELIELGSGSAIKTRILIDAILERQPTLTYHPIDISAEAVTESSLALAGAYERLRLVAYAGDYFPLLRDKALKTRGRVLALFLGSNIGNFEPADARELLHLLAAARHPGDGLLIGYDLKKDPSILELAYDDPTGVTAAFNKNLLARMNRELGADFDLHAFDFHARWNEERGAVRSFLESAREQRVRIPVADLVVDFAAGEAIHTESSYKFTRAEIVVLAASCGFAEKKTYTDAAGRYALTLLTVV
jgi:L-histidine N-alpha-methyltransferase